jgi:hypothetical protein
MNISICPPALIYIAFSLTQIVIDISQGLYNTAFVKFIVMSIIGFLLNVLCQGNLGIIAWILVFIPFALMAVITAILLYTFGLNETTGTTPTPVEPSPPPPTIDESCIIIPPSLPVKHGMSSEGEIFCQQDQE